MDEHSTVGLLSEETCWEAVQARDARYDGQFYFAVRSTGVYCKPSCPARRPLRENVRFFPTPEAAEMAGYRACRRCRPRDPSSAAVVWVERACQIITESETPPRLEALAERLGVSPYHFHRVFKAITGVTPRQYAASHRADQFKAGVRGGLPVTAALYEAGYGSSSRLYERAEQELGMTPASYRRGARGMCIAYTTTGCYLGRLLVASTGQGICAVSFAGDDETLVSLLSAEYPGASLERDDARLRPWLDDVIAYLEGKRPDLTLPLDVQATAFRRRVWEELRRIPYGETRTYAEVAAAVGRPKAVRAVANACAANPAALVTPCHRVVRSDGKPGGYRWGPERKEALLARERLVHQEADLV